jgi:outer membrane protein
MDIRKYFVVATAAFLVSTCGQSWALTLEDAVSMAQKNLPSYKASEINVKAADALYKASLSPYLPRLDTTTVQERHDSPTTGQFDLSTYDVTLSYTLFDGGKRRADRKNARLNLEIDQEEVTKNFQQLRFDVTAAFYSVMARNEIVEVRKIQQEDAQKDYEIAQARHEYGLVKLSDVLQASVRLEQAKFNRIQGEGLLRNGLSDLNSLLGRPLTTPYDLEGSLNLEFVAPKLENLVRNAMERPEIKQAEHTVSVSENNKAIEKSAFFPEVTANASYTKTDGAPGVSGSNEDKSIGVTATWNVFELGKFYRTKSASLSVNVSEEQVNETVRQLLLDLQKAYQDYLTASQNIDVAREQLKQAEHNYAQAVGEYRVGKGDILSLVQAESSLANAREQLTTSKLNVALAKALVERRAGIERLESLAP